MEETHVRQPIILADPVYHVLEKGSGMIFVPADPSIENRFQPKSKIWS